jgi:hypothetical protein
MTTNPSSELSKVLAPCEWNLEKTAREIPDWQLLMMLHYEYARSYKPIIDEVTQLRRKLPSDRATLPVSPFARFLFKSFPEFPSTSWAKINPALREEKLGQVGINEATQFYFQEPAWQAWEVFDPEALSLKEELTNFAAESYGVFKLDFSQEDEVIQTQFSAWLSSRRKSLMDKHDNKVQLSDGTERNANCAFQSKCKFSPPPGKGHKKPKCLFFLKALGGLRAFRYKQRDVVEAEVMTRDEDAKSLYCDEPSWLRCETQAAEMMQRLTIAWKLCFRPYDVFKYENMEHVLTPRELKLPLATSKNLSKQRRDKATSFLKVYFTVDALCKEECLLRSVPS